MDQVKKHWLLIVMGVVAVAAIVAVFVPLGGWFSSLQDEVDGSANKYGSIDGLRTKPRSLPSFTAEGDAEPERLAFFPTERAIEAGEAAVEEFAGRSEEVLQAAVDTNIRRLLVDRSLPLPAGTPRRRIIIQDYARAYEDRYNLDGDTPDQTLVARELAGTEPLTGAEIDRVRELRQRQIDSQRQITADGVEVGKEEADEMLDQVLAEVPRRLMMEKAEQFEVYVEPGAFAADTTIDRDNNDLTNIDVFWSQLRLWIHEIVAEAIAGVNDGSNNLFESPIKHVLLVEVNEQALTTREAPTGARRGGNNNAGGPPGVPDFSGFNPYGGGAFPGEFGGFPGAGGAAAPEPEEEEPAVVGLTVDPAAEIDPDFDISVTGRTSNPFYDVIPVTLRLRVDAASLPAVLDQLAEDRLVAIRNVSELRSVDNAAALADGFVYGEKPVVEVTLDAEVLLLRTWLQQYVPDEIKEQMTN